jgi:hypothetical protein
MKKSHKKGNKTTPEDCDWRFCRFVARAHDHGADNGREPNDADGSVVDLLLPI